MDRQESSVLFSKELSDFMLKSNREQIEFLIEVIRVFQRGKSFRRILPSMDEVVASSYELIQILYQEAELIRAMTVKE